MAPVNLRGHHLAVLYRLVHNIDSIDTFLELETRMQKLPLKNESMKKILERLIYDPRTMVNIILPPDDICMNCGDGSVPKNSLYRAVPKTVVYGTILNEDCLETWMDEFHLNALFPDININSNYSAGELTAMLRKTSRDDLKNRISKASDVPYFRNMLAYVYLNEKYG